METREDVNPDSKDKYGRTALSWAAGSGHEAIDRLLVGRERVSEHHCHGQWRKATMAVVWLLVGRVDVNPDSEDKDGRKSLLWAAENNHKAVVGLLCDCWEDEVTTSEDNDGMLPLSTCYGQQRQAVSISYGCSASS